MKFGQPEIGKVVRYLPDKKTKSARAPALASAWIAPKICQGQLQTIYLERHKFHSNRYTSGGVIAGRVNIVEARHKVFPILGEASSPNKYIRLKHITSVITVVGILTDPRRDTVLNIAVPSVRSFTR